jgi:hypothetical protein
LVCYGKYKLIKVWKRLLSEPYECKHGSEALDAYTFTKQFKQTSARKLMETVFGGRKGVLVVEFM